MRFLIAVDTARHDGALPELVSGTSLMANVPLMYANSLAPRYDVRKVWHQSAAEDPAHAGLRSMVRRLFQRAAPAGGTLEKGGLRYDEVRAQGRLP